MTVLFFLTRSTHLKQLIEGAVVFSLLFSMLMLTACGGGVVGDENNFVVVKDQTVTNLNEVTIESAVVDQNVMVVVYAAKADGVIEAPDKNSVLGFAALVAGEYTNVKIQLSRNTQNNETLFVELLADKGVVGSLELDTVDTVISQSTVTAVSFAVIHASVHLELVTVANNPSQYVAPNPERIDVKEVIVDSPSWLVVHRNNDGVLGDVIGTQFLSVGHQSNFSIMLNPRSQISDGDQIYIGIYNNASLIANDDFDPSEDIITTLNGNSVQLSLEIVISLTNN